MTFVVCGGQTMMCFVDVICREQQTHQSHSFLVAAVIRFSFHIFIQIYANGTHTVNTVGARDIGIVRSFLLSLFVECVKKGAHEIPAEQTAIERTNGKPTDTSEKKKV